jgi:RNA polymerase sigma factor (sigma-70 family)
MQETREPRHTTPPQTASPYGGAPLAFEEVYLRHVTKLRKIALRKFRIPPQEVEPLIQEVFVSYFLHADSVRAVGPYLVGAICNASRNYWRRLDAEEALFCGEVPCMATPGPDILEEVERKMLLRTLLARAGSRCREFLERYYWHGETTKAIADAFDSTPGSILVFLHKCRRRLLAAYCAVRGRG